MLTFNAVIREKSGTQESRRLRLNKKCPAVIYGKNIAPIAISLDHNHLFNSQYSKKLYGKKIILSIRHHNKIIVKIKEIKYHPFKPVIIHIDFMYI